MAKKHLDQSDITDLRFNYKDVKRGRSIIGFDIYVIKTTNAFELEKQRNQISARWVLSKKILEKVKQLGIVPKGKTLKIVENFSKHYLDDDEVVIEKLQFYSKVAIDKNKSIAGYVVSCMKNDVEK